MGGRGAAFLGRDGNRYKCVSVASWDGLDGCATVAVRTVRNHKAALVQWGTNFFFLTSERRTLAEGESKRPTKPHLDMTPDLYDSL
jgi:hypothetical protein